MAIIFFIKVPNIKSRIVILKRYPCTIFLENISKMYKGFFFVVCLIFTELTEKYPWGAFLTSLFCLWINQREQMNKDVRTARCNDQLPDNQTYVQSTDISVRLRKCRIEHLNRILCEAIQFCSSTLDSCSFKKPSSFTDFFKHSLWE